jgi:abortive infection bacteriophage resistance protein
MNNDILKIIGLPAPPNSVSQGRHFFMINPVKQATTYEQQLTKMIARGCKVDDEQTCKNTLALVNYYRFSAYFLPFKKVDGTYIDGTNFESVFRIYEFDRKIRGILFSALEKIEIFLRSNLAYYHAHNYGPLGYMDTQNYNSKHKHEIFMNRLKTELKNRSKELFVKHHNNKYNGDFPIWVMTEIFTFGMLSYFYGDLQIHDQKALAKTLFNTNPKNLKSWLRCCTDLRNICAHYGRLYFRVFTAAPAQSPNIPQNAERRLFGAIMVLNFIYPGSDDWNSEIYTPLKSLLKEYSNDIQLAHIGFPDDWEIKLKR